MFTFFICYLIAWITYYLLLSGYVFVSKNWANSLNNFFLTYNISSCWSQLVPTSLWSQQIINRPLPWCPIRDQQLQKFFPFWHHCSLNIYKGHKDKGTSWGMISIQSCNVTNQGCALTEPGGSWCLTFALGQLANLSFLIKIICWAPKILQVQSTRLPSILLRAQPCWWYSFLKQILPTSAIRKKKRGFTLV